MIRKFLLALMLVVSVASCVFAQQSTPAPDVKPTILDPVANKRVAEISSQLRCLVCQNQSIADSNAELAMDLKKQVVKQIAEGKSNQQIIDFMVDRYGDFVLYNPPFKLSTLLLWVGPALFFVLALAALFWTLAKRKKQKAVPLTEEQRKRAEALLKGQINQKGDH